VGVELYLEGRGKKKKNGEDKNMNCKKGEKNEKELHTNLVKVGTLLFNFWRGVRSGCMGSGTHS
jgi:hypothetical protein